jgi:hypothetical protein
LVASVRLRPLQHPDTRELKGKLWSAVIRCGSSTAVAVVLTHAITDPGDDHDPEAVRRDGDRDNAGGLSQVLRVGPGHELEAGAQAVAAGEVAKRTETVDQPRFVGVVAGDQQLARTEARRGGNRCARL